MAQFTVQRTIDTPRAKVWEILADYGNIASWSSGVAESGIIGEQATGVGAVRQCDVMGGRIIEERITEWNEGEDFRLVFDKMPGPFKDVSARFRLEGDDPTTVAIDYSFRGKGLGVLVAPLMKPVMRKTLRTMLRDLESACAASTVRSA